jgi:hypothetical protein
VSPGAEDEHRLGLKPVRRRVWAPVGQRPVALGHHRYQWLHVVAFVQPTSGEAVWYLCSGLSKPFFEALLASFARRTGAALRRLDLTLRTPDALNIAIAQRVGATLATFDAKMADAARALGTEVAAA